MNITPLYDRIIVKRLEAEKVTASGIIIPEVAGEKPDMGTVLSVGPGKMDTQGIFRATTVKEGDTVMFGQYSGQKFKMDGVELLAMNEPDVIGIVKKG